MVNKGNSPKVPAEASRKKRYMDREEDGLPCVCVSVIAVVSVGVALLLTVCSLISENISSACIYMNVYLCIYMNDCQSLIVCMYIYRG